MTPEEFDHLLSWLSSNREEGGRKYEEVRGKLIAFFTWSGCCEPEDLTDKTIDRFVHWMEHRNWEHAVEPIRILYGFAKNIRHEERRRIWPEPISPDIAEKPSLTAEKEHEHACLEACVSGLSLPERSLIRSYYQYAQAEKIKARQALATRMGLGMNALRIQAWKIRGVLRGCLDECLKNNLEEQPPGPSLYQ